MEAFSKFIDYFMDFKKVRMFQEFCGLHEKGSGLNRDVNYNVRKLAQKSSHDFLNSDSCARRPIDSDTSTPMKPDGKFCCREKESPNEYAVNYEVHNKYLHHLFLVGSMFGTEVFYITALPAILWNFDVAVGRMVITVWVVTMYIGQAAKDLLRWPRPTWPPAFKLETRVEAEYGLPSTHAIAATAVPFTMLIAAAERYNVNIPLGICLAVFWCALVSLSRIYVGMHSILDVMAGITLTSSYLYFGLPFMEMVNDYTMNSKYAPYIIIISHFLLAIFYPNSSRWSTSRGDTVVILGVGAGVHCASWFGSFYGFNWDPVGEPPYNVGVLTWNSLWIGLVRYLIGVTVLVLVRALMKYLSLLVLCHAASVPKGDEMSMRRTEIEVPYKFITYACVGFSANFLVLVLLLNLGIVV